MQKISEKVPSEPCKLFSNYHHFSLRLILSKTAETNFEIKSSYLSTTVNRAISTSPPPPPPHWTDDRRQTRLLNLRSRMCARGDIGPAGSRAMGTGRVRVY